MFGGGRGEAGDNPCVPREQECCDGEKARDFSFSKMSRRQLNLVAAPWLVDF